MAISVASIFKERKYPFIFALSFLLTCVGFLLLMNNQYSYFSIPDLQRVRSVPASPPPPPEVPDLPIPRISSGMVEDDIVSPNVRDDPAVAALIWELCKGSSATDYTPCLDNMKAIKKLRSRRHMEHRERHCPQPSPRCLVPLPAGYRVPLTWPKSRDMVRLMLLW